MDVSANGRKNSLAETRHAFMEAVLDVISKEKQVVCPVRNFFTGNQYIRETTVPAGVTLISEIHLTDHPFQCLKGEMIVIDELSGDCVKMMAGDCGVTKSGTRRLVTAIEDVIFSTYHNTKETDIEKIGHQILAYNPGSTKQWSLAENKEVGKLIVKELNIRRLQ